LHSVALQQINVYLLLFIQYTIIHHESQPVLDV